ncbi:MAG TPA: extracellular solute-binding protein, partial [Limnochordia bacterium]|nr:extracellular solute-binding protein [Limnochordia bacterium]
MFGLGSACGALWRMREWVFVSLLVFALNLVLSGVAGAEPLRVLLVGYSGELLSYLNDEVAPAFYEEYGIEVEITAAGWGDRTDRILLGEASGMPFDVVTTGSHSPTSEGGRGILLSLDRYIDEWDKKDLFPPAVWKGLQFRNQTYAVPMDNDNRAMAWNKGLFAESGLDPNEPPGSWDELLTAVRALTRVDAQGEVVQRGVWLASDTTGALQDFLWFLAQRGFDPIDYESYVSFFNRPEAFHTLSYLDEIMTATLWDAPGPNGPGGFVERAVAMTRHQPVHFRSIALNYPELLEEYGLFSPRYLPHTAPVSLGFTNGLGITASSRRPDDAWKFITFLHRDDILRKIEELGSFISGRIDVAYDRIAEVPALQYWYDSFMHMQLHEIPVSGIHATVGGWITGVYRKEMDPGAALENAHRFIETGLREFRQEVGLEP